ncbi:MAG: hypothetical protein ACK5QD_02995 [Brevundimonas sp.]|uniref:hypothetical protein n=1 Tax=Brevundimonas sp. TaxID=1871086 RepID=UPI0022CA020B|nr:hypothetical protein [Brevundimonas sp.]MCZ8193871.1 hypothetical protein [Brevundimonas sp.]
MDDPRFGGFAASVDHSGTRRGRRCTARLKFEFRPDGRRRNSGLDDCHGKVSGGDDATGQGKFVLEGSIVTGRPPRRLHQTLSS